VRPTSDLPQGPPAGFPRCARCPYFVAGPARICVQCAGAALMPIPQPHCPICSQELRDARCVNKICAEPGRAIERVGAIAVCTDQLKNILIQVKGNPASGWSVILGRLVIGWLRANVPPDAVDLIVANPTFRSPGTGPGHTEAVLEWARREDLLGTYPLPHLDRPLLMKSAATTKSRGTLDAKLTAAAALRDVLELPEGQESVRDQRILVYDDILTTGAQMDAIARFLKEHGARSVSGLVLARWPLSY
jgi:predicted amidophosphoribosyltransferase